MSATLSAPPALPRFESGHAATRACRHCGSPSFEQEFCCAGCAYVYRMIHDSGLEAYYQFKDAVTSPVDAALTTPRDHGWLASLQAGAEAAATGDVAELSVSVQGVSCVGCVWLIEKIFARQPGAGRIELNAHTGRARLRWMRGEFSATAFAGELQRFNYLLGPADATSDGPSESQRLAKRIGLCAAFSMNVMLFTLPTYFGLESTAEYAHLFATLSMGFATLSLLAGGGFFLNRAIRALRERTLHIDLPIALGIVGAYLGSFYGWMTGREAYLYFDFVSAFILLMLIGRWAQVAAVERNQRRLLREQPGRPCVRVTTLTGEVSEISSEQLRAGQAFDLPAGQIVPVEAKLAAKEGSFSLAWINGEAEPRVFRAGQRVPAGAQNLSREDVALVACQAWDESLLAELLRPVARATHRHTLIERVIQGYLIAIIGVAALAGAGWWWFTADAVRAGAVVTAVLVVSCPCALGLAFPLTDEIATVALRRRGVFVRATDLWVRLGKISRVVFDKTGTLTLELPVLRNPEALRELSTEGREALLALVSDSPHPTSRCLHAELLALGRCDAALSGEPREIVGCGLELGPWRLGRPDWAAYSSKNTDALAGATTLAWHGVALASFFCADAVREDARDEIAELKQRGLEPAILSGDHSPKVATLAEALGIPAHQAFGDCSPRDKADWVTVRGADSILMLGDGANDSLAFDRALCRGTPLVHRGMLEAKADFYYLGRGIGGIRALFEVNDARARTQRALLVFMILYNCLAVGLSVAGHMNPLLAAILMPVSSLVTLVIVGAGMHSVRRLTR
jgi:P-type Cu2+ transporter